MALARPVCMQSHAAVSRLSKFMSTPSEMKRQKAAGLEAATAEAIRSLEGDVVGLSVLGVGAGTAKLAIDQHRAVDVQLNAAFARALKASGRWQEGADTVNGSSAADGPPMPLQNP